MVNARNVVCYGKRESSPRRLPDIPTPRTSANDNHSSRHCSPIIPHSQALYLLFILSCARWIRDDPGFAWFPAEGHLSMDILLKCWLRFPSKFRLFTYQCLLRFGLWVFGPTTSPTCFRLPFNLYAKVGFGVDMSEANALRFVSRRVVGPIPSLIDALSVGDGAFIVMTGLPGKPLGRRLFDMSPQQRALLASDLKCVFDQLRSIPPPQQGLKICGVDGGPILCYRVCIDRVGPFATDGFLRIPVR
jgi:hypothetical protein